MPAYIHYRKFDSNGEVSAKGGATLSIEYVDELHEAIVVAMSECSKHDNFRKDIGRQNADERMALYREGTDPRFVYVFPRIKKMGLKENVDFFMSDYLKGKRLYGSV